MHVPEDLEDVIDFGDKLLSKGQFLINPISSFKIPDKISVNMHGLFFPSPIIFSSFKSHVDTLNFWLNLGAGGGCLKTITSKPRSGNDRPRICSFIQDETESLLNALGLPNPGIDQFLKKADFQPLLNANKPIGFSIAGETLEDYESMAMQICTFMDKLENKNFFLELNISCPNVNHGAPTKDLNAFFAMLQSIREKLDVVIGLKLSPETSNYQLTQYAEMMVSIERGFLTIGNTKYQTKKQLGLNDACISQEGGGVSGFSLFNRTLEMVQVLSKYKLPLIATGGVCDFHHARALLESGATLVGMATTFIQDPYMIPKINRKLSNLKKVHI